MLTVRSALTSYAKQQDIVNGTSGFSPIPDLQLPNADVSVLSIVSQFSYSNKVLDPWFRATLSDNSGLVDFNVSYIGSWTTDSWRNWYYPDRVLSVLGCTEQYQFCNSTSCSTPDGLYADQAAPYLGLMLNSDQKATFDLVWNATTGVNINFIANLLGDQLLLAMDKALEPGAPASGPLPPNQWEAEVTHIVNVMLAALQRRVVDYVAPPNVALYLSTGVVSSLSYITPPNTDSAKQMCNIVRFRNPAYYNFSVGGLILALFLGGAIVFVNVFCLPGVVFWATRRMGRSGHPREEWNKGHRLWLQRTAFESHGIRQWKADEKGGIPYIEESGVMFAAERAWKSDEKTEKLNETPFLG